MPLPFEDRLAELTPEQRELFELFLKKERLSLAAASRYRAPGTSTEEALVRIWSELLGVEAGVDDNYFELGGDSITIIRMMSQARAEGIALRAAWVFSHPTIAQLAALSRLQQPEMSETSPAPAVEWRDQIARLREADPDFDRCLARERAAAIDAYPLTPSQQGILYHALDRGSEGCYTVQWRFRLRGGLDVERFQRAWTSAIARHEAFRTIVQYVGADEPLQIVVDRANASIVEETAQGPWQARADEIFDEERRTEFDLRRAPLMRIRLLRVEEREWVCFWTHHHLILDGWSQQIFLKEFFALYRGRPLLPPVAGVFKDHIRRLRLVDQSAAAAFWRHQLSGYHAPATRLPAKGGGVHAVVTRSVSHAGRLRDALRARAVTLNVLFQAAWSLALVHLLEQTDVVFGVTCSGRSSGAPGIEQAVGLFINTLPLRLSVDESMPFAAWLERVQSEQAKLVQHESSSLIAIQNWIGWDRRDPLFESIVVYERFPLDLSELERGEPLEILDVETTTHEHYPVILVVQDDQDVTKLSLKHAAADLETSREFERLLDGIAAIPAHFLDEPDAAVGDVLTGLGARSSSNRPSVPAQTGSAE